MSPLEQLILLCKLLHSYLLIQIQNKMDILFLIYINNCHATYINILICGYENLLLIIFLLCTCLIVYQVWKCLEIWNKNATHISMRQRVFIRWKGIHCLHFHGCCLFTYTMTMQNYITIIGFKNTTFNFTIPYFV